MSRIVVIGAGVGGLAAAIRLAGAGHTVEVHERSAAPGGKLAVYERDGFRFDTGPSLLTLPQVFTDLLSTPAHVDGQHDINTRRRDAEVNIDSVNMDSLNARRLDPVVRHVFADGTVLDSSSTHEVFVDRIRGRLGPDAADDWERFWRRAERIWRASWRSVLRKPITPASLAGLTWRLNDLAAVAPGRTLRGLGWHYFRDQRLRMLLDRYATYTGTDPRRAPAALAAIPYAELNFGGWYLPGGLGTLTAALVARCRELGVRIVLGSEATAIEIADGQVRGVRFRDAAGPASATAANAPGPGPAGRRMQSVGATATAGTTDADANAANEAGARAAGAGPADAGAAETRAAGAGPADTGVAGTEAAEKGAAEADATATGTARTGAAGTGTAGTGPAGPAGTDAARTGAAGTGTAGTGTGTAGTGTAGTDAAEASTAGPLAAGPRTAGPSTAGPLAAGASTAADYVHADFVVSDVDALAVYRDLLPTPSRLAKLTERTLAGFVLLLGVRGETPELAHHTVYFPSYYDAEFDAIFGDATRRARPADDPTIFVTRAVDPEVHPAGCEAWFVLVNAPRHGTAWSAVDWRRPGLADAYGRHILDVLARRGLDVRDRLLFLETRTPADLADATNTPGGAIYGTTAGLLHPANDGPVEGLYLVGGSVHPGGGLPLAALSAQIVADRIKTLTSMR